MSTLTRGGGPVKPGRAAVGESARAARSLRIALVFKLVFGRDVDPADPFDPIGGTAGEIATAAVNADRLHTDPDDPRVAAWLRRAYRAATAARPEPPAPAPGPAPARPVWRFDRIDRLEDAIAHAREMETYLVRQRCDAADLPRTLALLDRRIAATRRRVMRLCARARILRRNARLAGAVPADPDDD
jgi:hypothetical protein